MSEKWHHARETEYRKYTLWFIYACVIYSIVGFSWGVIVSMIPDLGQFIRNRPHGDKIMLGHGHLNLLGWVEMAIFGSIYYIVPRLVGRPIHSLTLVKVHFWIHNVGLLGLVTGFVVAGTVGGIASVSLPPDEVRAMVVPIMMIGGLFGFLVLLANCIWGYNIYRTSIEWNRRASRGEQQQEHPARP